MCGPGKLFDKAVDGEQWTVGRDPGSDYQFRTTALSCAPSKSSRRGEFLLVSHCKTSSYL